MPDAKTTPLHQLADAVGLAASWQDVHGRMQTVSDESLEALLDAMGLECGNGARIECGIRRLREEAARLEGRMIVVEAGKPVVFDHHGPSRYRLEYESGVGGREGELQAMGDSSAQIAPVDIPGYHALQLGKSRLILAVTPRRCIGPPNDAAWGVAAQVYSLRHPAEASTDTVMQAALAAGDYGALARLAFQAGRRGAAALAISPVHALFSADPMRYSPYAPSSRLFLNVAYLDVLTLGEDALRAALASLPDAMRDWASGLAHMAAVDESLIDWPTVQAARLAIARALFVHFEAHGPDDAKQSFEAFRRAGGEALQSHCLYETLHGHYAKTLGPEHGWQDWPAPMQEPNAAAAQAFARQSAPELRFHAFMQWLADEGMRKAQKAALEGGMSMGLITDLAIGADVRGSQAWGAAQDILQGATVGAAPDLYHDSGQDWGLTAFSPRALREQGFQPFLSILRHALSHAGGVRIDHVLGLARMWLVPQGASAAQGAFLHYPLQDMLGLLALESHRHKAIVVGENLGTVPEGFNDLLSAKGVLGTSVLWFEREEQPPQRFIPAADWPDDAMATTTTHDLPTVTGWWRGTDIDWRHRLGRLGADELEAARSEREHDKHLLTQALHLQAYANDDAPLPEVLEWVAASPAPLCIFPLEDMLGLAEQPNMPGSRPVGEHPNWLRRLPLDVDKLFDSASVTLQAVQRGRKTP
ncbi:4-alpha-glucanotransferase [Pusillimonas sp.]|uniref:4-alpha-glucanotransferase n=1 Tax=Pusillimonas sp. TaxID=3040095 RepID=UPI0037C7522F